MRPLKVLGLGDNTVDTYVDLERQFPGGNAVNVAVMTKRLGAHSAYMGCLGEDAAGEFVRRALLDEGLDISHCRTVPGENARAFISHNGGDRKFWRSKPGVRAEWGTFDAADLAYLAGFDLVHSSIFSGLEPHLATLRADIRCWSLDFSERWTGGSLERLAPFLDIAIISSPEGGDKHCAALAREAAELGPRVVVITRGARGAMALKEGTFASVAAHPTTIVDTLGAGDAFVASFVLAELSGAPLADSLDAGATAAALACTSHGAFGHGAAWTGDI